MRKEVFLILLALFTLSPLVSAIEDDVPIQIQTTNSDGNIITGTFEIAINISNSSNCDSILYSDTSTRTTDNRGIISFKLENVSLNFDEQYWFCYYRDGKLKQAHKPGRVPFTFNSKYLGGYDENFFAPLNTSLTGDFNIQGSLFINGIDALNGSSEDTIPLNTVIFYNGTSCPQGFSELTDARGRYILGLNTSNGTLGASVGTALSNEENRPTGLHNHKITGRALTLSGGGTNVGDFRDNVDGIIANTASNTSDFVAGTNAPYVQYLTCIKTSTVDLTKGWNQDTSSIWVADTALSAIIGATSKVANEMLRVVGDSLFEGNLNVTGNLSFDNKNLRIQNPVVFAAYRNTHQTGVGAGSIIIFDKERFDVGDNYDSSTGRFTAPVSGYYQFSVIVLEKDSGQNVNIRAYLNGTNTGIAMYHETRGTSATFTMHLNLGDIVDIRPAGSTQDIFGDTGIWHSQFEGRLLWRD